MIISVSRVIAVLLVIAAVFLSPWWVMEATSRHKHGLSDLAMHVLGMLLKADCLGTRTPR